MNRDLVMGATVAVMVHVLLCVPVLRAQGATVNVARGLTSLEVELVAAAEVASMSVEVPAPEQPPVVPMVDDPWSSEERPVAAAPQQPSESAVGQGAFIETTSRGMPNRSPVYPWVARLRGWEGVVVLQVMVGADGRVARVGVAQSSGYALLDGSALDAVERWIFTPAMRFGRSVPSEVELPVRFRLSSSRGGES